VGQHIITVGLQKPRDSMELYVVQEGRWVMVMGATGFGLGYCLYFLYLPILHKGNKV